MSLLLHMQPYCSRTVSLPNLVVVASPQEQGVNSQCPTNLLTTTTGAGGDFTDTGQAAARGDRGTGTSDTGTDTGSVTCNVLANEDKSCPSGGFQDTGCCA